MPPVIAYSKRNADIMMMHINYQRDNGSLVTYTPQAQDGEEEEDEGDGRENFLCLPAVRNLEIE